MYTWGYIKENTLSKLNMSEAEANELGLMSRFAYYANEAMTMICSIKPDIAYWNLVVNKTGKYVINDAVPEFISFNTSSPILYNGKRISDMYIETEMVEFITPSSVYIVNDGRYEIPYNKRWYTFKSDVDSNAIIPAPDDVLDCIPSYIASQCIRVNDESEAAIFRNEFEILLSRLDDTSADNQRVMEIGGEW